MRFTVKRILPTSEDKHYPHNNYSIYLCQFTPFEAFFVAHFTKVMQIYFTEKEHRAFERLMKGNLVITFAKEILTAIGVT